MHRVNRRGLVVTSSGLIIGSAYTPPAPTPSADAVRIQRALLAPRSGLVARIIEWLEADGWVARFAGF